MLRYTRFGGSSHSKQGFLYSFKISIGLVVGQQIYSAVDKVCFFNEVTDRMLIASQRLESIELVGDYSYLLYLPND